MNQNRDIEWLLEAWLTDGPTVAPDRVVDVVVDRIERQGQRPAWRLDWRRYTMNANLKVAAAIAAAVIVAVIGYNLLPGSTGVGGPAQSASPSPTQPIPSPSPSPALLRSGPLDAGTHVTRPFGSPDENLAMTFSVPAGWSGFDDWALLGPKGVEAPDGIGIAFLIASALFRDPCQSAVPESEAGDEPVGPTVDDLANALVGHQGYVASTPKPVVLAGYSGKLLDLQLPEDLSSCPGRFFVWGHEGGSLFAQGPGAIWRLWILDVDGTRVIVVIDDYAATPDEDRAQAQAIVDSIRFTP